MARVGWGRRRVVARSSWSLLAAVVVALVLPLSAQAFDPAHQSGPGACSENTESVAHAVGDLKANAVLRVYADSIRVGASNSSLVAKMKKALAIGVVTRGTVTTNHGCDGHGHVFPVGARTLYPGETVGVKVPPGLRSCAPRAAGCRAVAIVVHVVFPTNCWNLNAGTIPVLLYVHRVHRKTEPKPKVADPAASAALICAAGGVVVTLSNGASATAPAWFEVNGVDYGPLAPGASQRVTIAIPAGGTNVVAVSSGERVLVAVHSFTNTCTTPPTTVPSATAALTCSAGGVVITMSNDASATQPSSFTVNGTAYGPVAPGASQTATLSLAPGATVRVTVISGSQVLIANQPYTNNCTVAAPAPNASASLSCSNSGGGTLTVTLTNGVAATAPASFTVSTSENGSVVFGPNAYGPLAPGASTPVMVPVDAKGLDLTLTVTSGSTTIFTQTYQNGCPPTA